MSQKWLLSNSYMKTAWCSILWRTILYYGTILYYNVLYMCYTCSTIPVLKQYPSQGILSFCSKSWVKYLGMRAACSKSGTSCQCCLIWDVVIIYYNRAATLCYFFLKYHQEIQTENLEPLLIRKTIPICMWQYERTFKTTR